MTEPLPDADQPPVETADVLGMPVAKLTLDGLLARIDHAARRRGGAPLRIAYANAHSVNLFVDDPDYRAAMLAADLIYADGNGPRVAAWLSGQRLPPRMTGADWIHDLCRLAERHALSLYLLGGAPGVAEQAVRRLRGRWPALSVAGLHHGFFGPAEEDAILAEIGRLRPHVLVLAMGSPHQETWMAEHGLGCGAAVVWAGGGVLDYASGRVRRAPRLLRRLGLEWLGRALIEPRRLGPRYLRDIPRFVWRAARYAVARPAHRVSSRHIDR